jgi:5-methylcytosine-specific restriction enzyme subunit McrC
MINAIPVENIYYLLCYAYNKLDEGELVNIRNKDITELVDLFGQVLANGISRLLKIGLDRGYKSFSEESRMVKGRIDFNLMVKKYLFSQAKVQSEFDELSYDVLHNRILKSTVELLLKIDILNKNIWNRLSCLKNSLHEVSVINLNKSHFRCVQLHSNNSFYAFLLDICELIYDNILISEKNGDYIFRDFIRDERQMAYLFEEFVRNFYRIEQVKYNVFRENIDWMVEKPDSYASKFLPRMQTDISLESDNRKIIIDTKFYREVFQDYYENEKIKSHNLYQLFSYLKNIESLGGLNKYCEGILLYPAVKQKISLDYIMSGHKVSIKTINLNQDWKKIKEDLFDLIKN